MNVYELRERIGVDGLHPARRDVPAPAAPIPVGPGRAAGAAAMGIGGAIALGCSVGQGLTAFSVLAYGAPVTVAAANSAPVFARW